MVVDGMVTGIRGLRGVDGGGGVPLEIYKSVAETIGASSFSRLGVEPCRLGLQGLGQFGDSCEVIERLLGG